MPIKEIVCESCDASFTIEYEMLGHQYDVKFCPFCGADLDEDDLHEIEVNDVSNMPSFEIPGMPGANVGMINISEMLRRT